MPLAQSPIRAGTEGPFPVSGQTLARNTILNFGARLVSLAIAVAAMPYVIHHLGPDRFGLLSLAWIVVGYFALFDLGIGPATTKFVAELLGKGEAEKLPELVWTALASQVCFGFVAGILLAAATPALVSDVLRIPASLQTEARVVFFILAVSFPIDFANGSLQGVLMATQRFDLVNAVAVPSSALTYLVPVGALALGFGLPAIVLGLVVARLAAAAVLFALDARVHPSLAHGIRFNRRLVRSLVGYGGWVTVSGAVGPVLVYFDRFLIGALISIAAVGFYQPPYMISTKLWILPTSLMTTLFPAFSSSAGRGDMEWVGNALIRSLKFLLLLVGPVAVVLVFFAHPILTIWLGPKFAAEGTAALQILAVGVLINSLAQAPSGLLLGIGRPDLTAKFHLAELPVHVVLAWVLVSRFGLAGASLVWTIRVSVDFILLTIAACRVTHISPRFLVGRDMRRVAATLATLTLALSITWIFSRSILPHALMTLLLGGGFLLFTWRYVMNWEEKWQVKAALKLHR